MKKGKLFLAAALATTMGFHAAPAKADVSVHISLGGPRAVAYHPVYFPHYFYNAAYAPNLLFVPQLGFYVSVGLPYDLLFFNNIYYVYHGDHWYHSHYHRGPWVVVKHNRLPRHIRKHRWHKIRDYCDREYRKHHRHRWLKHRNHAYKERKRSIRSSPYYHAVHPRVHNAWAGKPDYERKDTYRERSGDERRKAYKARHEHERRKTHVARSKNERKKFFRTERGHKNNTVGKEHRRTKRWGISSGNRVAVHEKTTKTRRLEKPAGYRQKRLLAEKRNSSPDSRHYRVRTNRNSRMHDNYRKFEAERAGTRWTRVGD